MTKHLYRVLTNDMCHFVFFQECCSIYSNSSGSYQSWYAAWTHYGTFLRYYINVCFVEGLVNDVALGVRNASVITGHQFLHFRLIHG